MTTSSMDHIYAYQDLVALAKEAVQLWPVYAADFIELMSCLDNNTPYSKRRFPRPVPPNANIVYNQQYVSDFDKSSAWDQECHWQTSDPKVPVEKHDTTSFPQSLPQEEDIALQCMEAIEYIDSLNSKQTISTNAPVFLNGPVASTSSNPPYTMHSIANVHNTAPVSSTSSNSHYNIASSSFNTNQISSILFALPYTVDDMITTPPSPRTIIPYQDFRTFAPHPQQGQQHCRSDRLSTVAWHAHQQDFPSLPQPPVITSTICIKILTSASLPLDTVSVGFG
ncbi:unnamed protein product [Tilletia controversa]|nr:unnamed protein product [Tilletia controversa]